MFPSRTNAPRSTSFCRLNQYTCACVFLLIAHAGRIVGIQHGKIFGLLVLKDARLGGHIILERAVAVKMVRRDVQHDRDYAAESS